MNWSNTGGPLTGACWNGGHMVTEMGLCAAPLSALGAVYWAALAIGLLLAAAYILGD